MSETPDIQITIKRETPDVKFPIDIEEKEVKIDVNRGGIVHTEYQGATIYTPLAIPQTIQARGKIVLENIIINPIPQNYGRVSFNGRVMTVQ